jgi:hypothetical protein
VGIDFSEPLDDTAGAVSDPANYQLVFAGPNEALETTTCAVLGGDDVAVPLTDLLNVDNQTVSFSLAGPGEEGQYELRVCAELTDEASLPLDGNGDLEGGDDFRLRFRVVGATVVQNAHFDCSLVPWTRSDPTDTLYDEGRDADDSASSGSALLRNPDGDPSLALGQCIETGEATLAIRWHVYPDLAPDTTMQLVSACTFYDGSECTGHELGHDEAAVSIPTSGATQIDLGTWNTWDAEHSTAAGTTWSFCRIEARTPEGVGFELNVDHVSVNILAPLFEDDFETGDCDAWSASIP